MKRVIFTLSSARSGTLFLRDLFRRNLRDCDCRHETFFDWGNPTMLGPAVYDAYAGRLDKLRALLEQKRAYINRLPGTLYLESSHAFLKSAYRVAMDVFPELQLIHLIRDPLKVSKSEAYREEWRRRVHAPFHYYRGDDSQRHFFWSLTGNEPLFRYFERSRLSLFQWYLIQWIEIENRAMAFLKAHRLEERCFTLQAPAQLNDPAAVRAMFEFFDLKPAQPEVVIGGRKNKNIGRRTTVITDQDERESEEVLARIPAEYLEIFHHQPYASQRWSTRLQRGNRAGFKTAPEAVGARAENSH